MVTRSKSFATQNLVVTHRLENAGLNHIGIRTDNGLG